MRYLIFALLLSLNGCLMAQYDDDYRQIEALMEEGKYRSALELAEEVYESGARSQVQHELVKALGYRIQLTQQLEEDGYQAALDLVRTELARYDDLPVFTALAHLLAGELLYEYAQQNQWRLSEATELADAEPSDTTILANYSLGQLLDASRRHLYRALVLSRTNRTELREAPAVVVIGDEGRRAELPTLYDLMVGRALAVLGSNLGSLTDDRPADAEALLAPARAFTRLDLTERYDTTKGTGRSLMLYQHWLRYRRDDGNRVALLHADLERMRYVRRLGAADSTYLAALERMYDDYRGAAIRDRILVEQAEVLDTDSTRVRALNLLDRVGDDDPVARVQAARLRAAITAPSLGVQTLNFYPRRQPLLVRIDYRNVERLHYRVHAYDPAESRERSYRTDEQLDRILNGRRVATGSQRLAPNDDYSPHATELSLAGLPAGGYYLLVSDREDFDEAGLLSVADFQVSDLAVVKVDGPEENFVQVADRTTGAPLADVEVELYRENRRGEGYRRAGSRRSNAQGTFRLPGGERYVNYQLMLTKGNDRLVTDLYEYRRRRANGRRQQYTTLLTDRPLYRPGQTVHVYGLLYEKDAEEMPRILSGKEVTLTLYDANRQEVSKQAVSADDYGRFSADFELPESGLTGAFTIQSPHGMVSLQVEEYKRPRFFVELDVPEGVTPGETVTLSGEAMTYAGPPVVEGRVSYRVFLEEIRWWYWGGGSGGERELVVSGTAETGEAGDFTIDFTAPENLSPTGRRRLRYVLEVDVADATGETHAASAGFAVRGERPAVVIQPDEQLIGRGDSLVLRVGRAGQDSTPLTIDLRIVPVEKPNAALLERPWEIPDRPTIERRNFARNFPNLAYAPTPGLSEWPARGDAVYRTTVEVAGTQRILRVPVNYAVGHYRVEWSYPDGAAGEPATFGVYDGKTGALPAGVLYHLDMPEVARVGEPLTARLLAAVDLPLIFSQWASRAGAELQRDECDGVLELTYTPDEADRGGLGLSMLFVRFNDVWEENRRVGLPWDNKRLKVTYTTFRDRLRPGEPERWTVALKNADGTPTDAAALATMYDASLDQIYGGGGWAFDPYPSFYGGGRLLEGGSFGRASGYALRQPQRGQTSDTIPRLPYLILRPLDAGWAYGLEGDMMLEEVVVAGYAGRRRRRRSAVMSPAPVAMDAAAESAISSQAVSAFESSTDPPPTPQSPPPNALRTNLQETAFWLPELTAGPDGSLRIGFDSPEALTTWKFRVFAHDRQLNYLIDEREVVTQKELMVLPNVPRFLREGDDIELTARVSNLTDTAMEVRVNLALIDGTTNIPHTSPSEKTLHLRPGAQETVGFPVNVSAQMAGSGLLTYRLIAQSERHGDGEENVIPVLSDRTLVTVSKPFYLRRGEQKQITLDALEQYSLSSAASGKGGPDDQQGKGEGSYTFQATTKPAWLALKALPYLMEYPYDCTEQLANRYFANQLAYRTVRDRPVLQEAFERWRADSTALLSELERNQELKNALLEETPWVRAAQSESAQRARIGELFKLNKLAREQRQALRKLANRQGADGAYSWFPGGPANRYMTQYVLETLGRMRRLGAIDDEQRATTDRIAERAVRYLDSKVAEDYERLFATTQDSAELREEYMPAAYLIHYLYARAMSGAGAPTGEAARALDFFRERAYANWTEYGLYEQALICQTSDVSGEKLAETILASLRERALHSDETGMYWKYGPGFQWHNLPIETHTRILETFRTVDPRQEELDEMRLWLLTNKRTNHWPTTKATAAAVYALLNGGETFVTEQTDQPILVDWPDGSNELSTRARAQQIESAEAATGQFTFRLDGDEVSPDLATVRVKNQANDLVWGGIFWQYTAPAEHVQASNDGPLQLERELYRKGGDRLLRITEATPLQPGDRVTVRLRLTSDRALDYVHLKDRRAAALEPVEQLSGYRFSGGLGYYFAPQDLATNFFIDQLPRGSYLLEYDMFVTYRGSFSSGLGRVQCMYAPEFGANTGGERISVP